MTLSRFIVLNAVLAILDFAITYGLETRTETSLLLARSCGSAAVIAGLLLWANHASASRHRYGLPVFISVVTIIMNYGLFTLLHFRNTILNWHVLFAITTMAALLSGAAGYRRALTKHTSRR